MKINFFGIRVLGQLYVFLVQSQTANDDIDGDSMGNLEEFAFGGNILIPDEGLLPQIRVFEESGSNYFEISWMRFLLFRGNYDEGFEAIGVRYNLELSTDISSGNWISGSDIFMNPLPAGPIPNNNNPGYRTHISRTVNPISSPSFVRLKLELME